MKFKCEACKWGPCVVKIRHEKVAPVFCLLWRKTSPDFREIDEDGPKIVGKLISDRICHYCRNETRNIVYDGVTYLVVCDDCLVG